MANFRSILHLVAGDHGQPVLVTLHDKSKAADGQQLNPYDPNTWAPLNLDNVVAIRLLVRRVDQTQIDKHTTLAKIADFSGPTLSYARGQCILIWSKAFFATAGRYKADLSLEWYSGATETLYSHMEFLVRERMQ